MAKMGYVAKFTIYYSNIRHGLHLLKQLKAANFDYYRLDKICFEKGEITGILLEKKYPFCPIRSTWSDVEFYDRLKVSNLSYRSAKAYAFKY